MCIPQSIWWIYAKSGLVCMLLSFLQASLEAAERNEAFQSFVSRFHAKVHVVKEGKSTGLVIPGGMKGGHFSGNTLPVMVREMAQLQHYTPELLDLDGWIRSTVDTDLQGLADGEDLEILVYFGNTWEIEEKRAKRVVSAARSLPRLRVLVLCNTAISLSDLAELMGNKKFDCVAVVDCRIIEDNRYVPLLVIHKWTEHARTVNNREVLLKAGNQP